MADYLVDKNRGSDSNNGISAPKRTISFLASATLNSGDNVLFAADSVFTDAPTGIGTVAGTKAAPVTFGAYFPTGVNTGRPTFSYLRSMAAGDWTWDAVFNGWYFSPGYSPGESSYIKLGGQHWGYFHFGVSALDGDDYEWARSGSGAGTKLYLWAPESTNPTDYYGSVDFAPSARGPLIFSSDGAYVVIEGLHVENGSALTLIYSSSGTREYVVRDITSRNSAGILSVNTDTGGALSLTVDRCEGHLSPGAMIFAFPTSGVGIAKFHATNNVFSGAGHAWTQGAIYTKVRNADQLIAWNDISDCPHGAGYGVYDGCGIYAETGSGGVRVIGNRLSRMHLGAIDNSGRNAVWSGNVFVDVKSALKLDDEASVGSTDHKFLCNTIIRSGSSEFPSLGIEESGNGWRAVKNLSAVVTNNLFVAASGASALYPITTPTSGTGSIANNLAYGFAGLAINSSGGAASPTPTNSLTSDPLLDSSYRPLAASPCIGAGLYLKSARHYGGKRMSPVSPTIGAHGYYAAREIATDRTKYGPFAPSENYSVLQGDGTTYTASVGAKTRRHDYGGSLPIVRHDGATGINFAQHSGVTNSAGTIEATYPTGEAGHYERLGPKWRIAYTTGEALTGGTARCQLLSYPLPPGRMTFDMNVQFGDATDNWTLTTNGTSPALFWQLKPNTGPQPVFQLNVDTDSTNASKLEIYFNYKELSFSGSVTRLATVRGIDRHTSINVVVDGLFTFGNDGWVELRVNGAVIYRRDNFKTLQTDTNTYYHMHWGLYMWNDTNPATAPTRVTWWARNNVLVPQDVVRDIATDRPVRLMVAT